MLTSRKKTPLLHFVKLLLLFLLPVLLLSSCNSRSNRELGIVDSRLTFCPSSPNCVSSDTENPDQQVKPFELKIPPEKAWGMLVKQVLQLPRTKVVRQDARYLHVECRSQIFGFVDDVEFHLRPEGNIVAVRSSSRTGYYDFEVNRSRIEKLREDLRQKGGVQ